MSESRVLQEEVFFKEVLLGKNVKSLTDGIRLKPQVLKKESIEHIREVIETRAPVVLPWIGFGTYKLARQAKDATLKALEIGYRHIDTAFIYSRERTEALVGEAVRLSLSRGLLKSRDDVFITTKHWRSYHGYQASLQCLELSLERLKLDYVDLWLMHWPGPAWKPTRCAKAARGGGGGGGEESKDDDNPWSLSSTASTNEEMIHLRAETWRAMEDAYLNGKARAIGVCNFSIQHLETLRHTCRILPMVNQVELHPLHPQTDLLEYCKLHGITVQAYASLGGQDTTRVAWEELLGSSGGGGSAAIDLLHAQPVVEMANKYQRTPAQILLKWALQQNCVVIPKSSNQSRMQENSQLFDFAIEWQEMASLSDQLLNQVRHNNEEFLKDDYGGETYRKHGRDEDNNNGNDAPRDGDVLDNHNKLQQLTRLCWRGDLLRLLNFD